MTVTERFLKYVRVHTTSDEESDTTPSTARQFDLARILADELSEMGFESVKCDEMCYVYGCLPASAEYTNSPSIGLIAHIDTSSAASGENVNPQIIQNYDGKDVLLKGTGDILRVSEFPDLEKHIGKTLITTDGTTLLGGDDKAGIAEILTAMEEIIAEKLPHPEIWVAFTPDEEIGHGADHFDYDYFGADYAYTVDGGYEGDINSETFFAASARINITGISVHPGDAKNIMVNAAALACELQSLLPAFETPEHTEKYEGFYHLTNLSGDVSHAQLDYIIRDHNEAILNQRIELLRQIVAVMKLKYPLSVIDLDVSYQYKNMKYALTDVPYIIENAKKAMIENGVEYDDSPIRGGTDGANLSYHGLPCPNLGTGVYAMHGIYEHICVESMETVVKILKSILKKSI